MDFQKWFEDALAIIKLDEDTIRRVASDEEATLPAIIFLAIGGLASAIGGLNPFAIVLIVLLPLFMAISNGILWFIAKLFGGTGEYLPQFRPIGIGSAINWISVIPFLGMILGLITALWHIAITVVTIKVVHDLSLGKAIAVVLTPLILCCSCFAVLMMLGMGSMLAGPLAEALGNAR
jgi:hypothetical protein